MKNKNLILYLVVVVIALCTTTNNVLAQSFSDMESLSKQMDEAIKKLDNLNINNPTVSIGPTISDSKEPVKKINTKMMIAAGDGYVLGLKTDGTVITTGISLSGADQVSDWSGITMVAAGFNHSVGLKEDGTVLASGSNSAGEANVESWRDIKMVVAGLDYTAGLKKDGTVVAVGSNQYGKIELGAWKNITEIAGGSNFTVGLKSDGTVVAIGKNCSDRLNVSSWRDIVDISASFDNIFGLKKDGTVVNTMRLDTTQLKNAVAITSSLGYAAILKKDGTVTTNSDTVNTTNWKDVIAITAGPSQLVGLKADGTVVTTSANDTLLLARINTKSWQLKVDNKATVVESKIAINSQIIVNNKKSTIESYLFDKNIYVKISDLAFVLNKSNKQFSVDGDGIKKPFKLLTKKTYKSTGSELKRGSNKAKTFTKTNLDINIDGRKVNLVTYKIDGEIYVKLNDLTQKLNINSAWNSAVNKITIDTKKNYK